MRTALKDITNRRSSATSSIPRDLDQTRFPTNMPTTIPLAPISELPELTATRRTVRFANEESPPATELQGSVIDSENSLPELQDTSDYSLVNYLSAKNLTRI